MVGEPDAGKEVLQDNHSHANHHGIGDAQLVIAGKAVAAEDGAADDGLQQIVGETHAAKDAQVMEHAAHTVEGIPRRDDSRDNHEEDDEVADGPEPGFQLAEISETQQNDAGSRREEYGMPVLQVAHHSRRAVAYR